MNRFKRTRIPFSTLTLAIFSGLGCVGLVQPPTDPYQKPNAPVCGQSEYHAFQCEPGSGMDQRLGADDTQRTIKFFMAQRRVLDERRTSIRHHLQEEHHCIQIEIISELGERTCHGLSTFRVPKQYNLQCDDKVFIAYDIDATQNQSSVIDCEQPHWSVHVSSKKIDSNKPERTRLEETQIQDSEQADIDHQALK